MFDTDGVIQEDYYDTINQKFPAYNYLNENPNDLDNYITLASDRSNIRPTIISYNNQKCSTRFRFKMWPTSNSK